MVAFSADVVAVYYKAPQLTILLPWLSIAIVVITLSQMLVAILQRSFAFKAIAVGEIASALVALVATIAVALDGHGVWALVVGQLVAGAARLLMFLPYFLQLRRGLPIRLDIDLQKARGFALFQTGERVLNYVGWNIDKLILGRFVGEVGLGLYTVAYQLMLRPLSVLNPIFTRVALPLFSTIKNDDPRLISGYLQTLRVIALLSFPVYVGISIAAPGIIMLVMGEKWAASAPVLSLLSVLGMFFSIGNPIGALILAKGKPQLAFYFNLASLLVYALAFAIGAHFGVMGVAWAFLLAGVVVLYPLEFILRYQLVGMGVSQYLQAMMHLFTAAAVPLLVHGLWQGLHGVPFVPQWSFLWGAFAVLFFYGYVRLFEKPLLISVKNLIFKGK
jgi:O-antigen/teichoic acid export membrane protein